MENKYIVVTYKLRAMRDGKSTLVEEATALQPFCFISGLGETLDRFEAEIAPLGAGDRFDFVIPSAEAYGEYVPEGVRTVPKEMLAVDGRFDDEHVYPGAVVPLQDSEGRQFRATVAGVTADSVTLDLNHPHAGKDLRFEGRVMESRPATNAELQRHLTAMSEEGCGGCGGCGGGDCCGGGCGGCH